MHDGPVTRQVCISLSEWFWRPPQGLLRGFCAGICWRPWIGQNELVQRCVLSTHPETQAVSAFHCIPLFTSGFSTRAVLARNPKRCLILKSKKANVFCLEQTLCFENSCFGTRIFDLKVPVFADLSWRPLTKNWLDNRKRGREILLSLLCEGIFWHKPPQTPPPNPPRTPSSGVDLASKEGQIRKSMLNRCQIDP